MRFGRRQQTVAVWVDQLREGVRGEERGGEVRQGGERKVLNQGIFTKIENYVTTVG